MNSIIKPHTRTSGDFREHSKEPVKLLATLNATFRRVRKVSCR